MDRLIMGHILLQAFRLSFYQMSHTGMYLILLITGCSNVGFRLTPMLQINNSSFSTMTLIAKWIKILLSDRLSYVAVTIIEDMCSINVSWGIGAWLLFMNSKYVNMQLEYVYWDQLDANCLVLFYYAFFTLHVSDVIHIHPQERLIMHMQPDTGKCTCELTRSTPCLASSYK